MFKTIDECFRYIDALGCRNCIITMIFVENNNDIHRYLKDPISQKWKKVE